MSDIKVINNFINNTDRLKLIKVINDLMRTVNSSPDADGYDGRFVFFRPSDPEAIKLIKKYSAKVMNNYDYSSGVFLHDVTLAKSFPGTKLDVHMDFDNNDACTQCPYASVIYLNKDYTGAEIFFPELDERYSPESGTAIIFPQDDPQYAHGVDELLSGERYIINICYTKDVTRQFNLYK